MAFQLQWENTTVAITAPVYFDVTYSGRTSDSLELSFSSPAILLGTTEVLSSVKLYLDGPDVDVLNSWTYISSKVNLNGGVEISFDDGRVWTRFSPTVGNKAMPSTWVTLPGEAIGSLGVDGTLNPFDTATILLRLVVPPGFTDYRILAFYIGVDYDVI